MKKLLTIWFLCCYVFLNGYAQTDTVFWFAPPDLEISHQQVPIRFCLTTYDEPAVVTFSQPANASFVPVSFNIPANNFHVYDVSDLVDIMETKPINTIVSRGMYITSTTPVSCYYESVGNNSEIYTLKGGNALGMDFLVPMQAQFDNHYNSSTSSIEIIATEDNTVVQITAPVALRGGIPANSTVTVTLQRGQSYAIRADGTAASAHLQNTVIHSNKPIAVNSTDDSVYAPGGCFDLIGDQLVPLSMVGTHYVALRNNSDFEYLFIYPVENQTTVSINGATQPMLNVGQSINYSIPSSSTANLIVSDNPVVVFQMTAIGCELGGTMLPQIECTGSHTVTHLRPDCSESVVTILVSSDHVSDFLFNGSPNVITAANFHSLSGYPGFSYCVKNVNNNVSIGSVMKIQNSEARFLLGVLDGTQGGDCSYGFFSDYAQSSYIHFDMDTLFCEGDNIEFGYSAPNIENLELTGPMGLSLTTPPFVLSDITVERTGWYYLEGTDTSSCFNEMSDSVFLTVVSPSELTEFTAEACTDYVWFGETLTQTGDYTHALTNRFGCDSVVILHLTITEADPTLHIVSSTADFCEDQKAELLAVSTLNNYLWNTGETTPNITVTAPGIYSVTVTSGNCHTEARYTIEACQYQLVLPNVITPSKSDGVNDWFYIPEINTAAFNTFEISIFNRWGEQVFYSTDKNFRWNGEFNGKIHYNSVYNYIIRYTDANGKTFSVTGRLTVL